MVCKICFCSEFLDVPVRSRGEAKEDRENLQTTQKVALWVRRWLVLTILNFFPLGPTDTTVF